MSSFGSLAVVLLSTLCLFTSQSQAEYTYIPAISNGIQVYLPSVYIPIRIAHASLACVAWVIFFPLGGILLRKLPTRYASKVHVCCQVFAYMVFLTAAALGIWMSRGGHITSGHHPVIGLILLAGVTLQLMLGTRNHFVHVQRKAKESVWSIPLGDFHKWYGRFLLTLGILNGGLGFLWSKSSGRAPKIAYGIIAGTFWVSYMAVNVLGREYWKPRDRNGKGKGGSERIQEEEMDGLRT